jgi:hypothetical protein
MGGLVLFVFVAFVLLGMWRIAVAAKSARGDSHLPEVYMGGQGGGALPMIDVLKVAGRTK